MPFQEGHKLGRGRPKGAENKNTIMKDLLADAFKRNEAKAKKLMDEMFDSPKDFKWISELKASLEPKAIEHTGENGGAIRLIIRPSGDRT